MKRVASASAWVIAAALAAAPVAAQTETPQDPSASDQAPVDNMDEIVVTGRAGRTGLRQAEASYAITTIDDDRLRLVAPLSTAELFKSVPGFWVEASGGEGSNNIRSRGIPLDGYSTISLQENGLPVQHDGGLGYLNADQSFRVDETIARVEAVRGGPASIFAPNAPGGAVNFITRKGGEETGGLLKFTIGDYDLYRVDGYFGDRIGDWRFFVGGFYRTDDGIRETGFRANKGGQVRASIGRDFEGGSIDIDVKHIDDRVAFYLPVPLTFDADGDIVEVPGFDANNGTLAGPENALVQIKNVGSPYAFDLTEGTHTELSQITAMLRLDLGAGIELQSNTRYRDSEILRNGLFPTGSVQPLASQLAADRARALAAFPTATNLVARYATSPGTPYTAATGNGLVVGGNLLSVSVPLEEFITDNRLVKEFEAGGSTHNVAVGAYFADYQYRFDRYMGTTLLEVADQARRLDVVAVDAAGAVVGSVTDNGFLRYGSIYDNVGMQARAFALYASDEWQITDELRVDFGARWEKTDFNGAVETKRTINLGDRATLADDQVLTGTGQYVNVDRTFDDWGWTVGANYQFQPNFGLFARYTDTFKLPSAGEYNGNPTRTDQRSIPIRQAEVGAKYASRLLNLFATGFYTKFEGVAFTDNVFNTATNSFEQRFATADTVTYGLEAEALLRPVGFFDLALTATWQKPEYRGFRFTEVVNGAPVERNFSGNQLLRVPELALRAVPAVNLFDGRFRTELEIEHYTKRYPDVANSQELPSFTVLNLNARAALTDAIAVNVNLTNLTNTIGLTEGNPRAGSFTSGDAGARYFLARPILGRAVRASVSYAF